MKWTIGEGFSGQEINKLKQENALLAKHIVELQKDKGDLIDKVKNLQSYLDTQNCYRECAETWKKLEQAKEIIQKAVFQNICYNCDYGIDYCSQCRNGTLRKQTERFLKEIEK